ncbi:hypothetical protein D9M70_384260 [compost metagenome]
MRHFRDAAGIIRHRTEGIECHNHTGKAEHGGDGDAGPEEAGELVGEDDAANDDDRRQGRRFQRDGKPLDHVGAMAGDRSLGDRVHRPFVGAGIIFRDHHDQGRHDQAENATEKQIPAGDVLAVNRTNGAPSDRKGRGCAETEDRQHAGDDQTPVESAHDRIVGTELDEEGADDRSDDAGCADGQRIDHDRREQRRAGEEDRRQHHGRDDRDGVGLEQVGRHAGAIADIVADVIGNRCRIARIVFRNAGLHLADEIAANVGTLGEDAAAETGEDGNQRSAETERDQRVDDFARGGLMPEAGREDDVVDGDAEKRQARYEKAGNRA